MRKLKRLLLVVLILAAAFFIYVEVTNRNSKNMTYRQKVLKAIYPATMWLAKLSGKNATKLSNSKYPAVSFYNLKAIKNNGDTINFSSFLGKKVLVVNTASECGYTGQYAELEKLAKQYKDKLVVLGFPANDFKEQEKGTDEEIATFCKANFGVTFPLMKKSIVIKSPYQNPVYQWLSEESKNGWNNKVPSWNFAKYIINEKGILTNYFESSISPLSKDIIKAIE